MGKAHAALVSSALYFSYRKKMAHSPNENNNRIPTTNTFGTIECCVVET